MSIVNKARCGSISNCAGSCSTKVVASHSHKSCCLPYFIAFHISAWSRVTDVHYNSISPASH